MSFAQNLSPEEIEQVQKFNALFCYCQQKHCPALTACFPTELQKFFKFDEETIADCEDKNVKYLLSGQWAVEIKQAFQAMINKNESASRDSRELIKQFISGMEESIAKKAIEASRKQRGLPFDARAERDLEENAEYVYEADTTKKTCKKIYKDK